MDGKLKCGNVPDAVPGEPDRCAKLLIPMSNFTHPGDTVKMQFLVITEIAKKHNYCIYYKLLDLKTHALTAHDGSIAVLLKVTTPSETSTTYPL